MKPLVSAALMFECPEQESLPAVRQGTCMTKPLKPAALMFECPEQESNLHTLASTRF